MFLSSTIYSSRSQSPTGNELTPNVHFIIIFDILYGIGLVFLLPILFTALRSPHVKRTSTWFTAVGSWVITSLTNLILLGQQTGPPSSKGVCLMQAMFVYASPVLLVLVPLYVNSFSAAAFMFHVYFLATCAVQSKSEIPRTRIRLLHFLPWFAFLCILAEVLITGLLDPKRVEKDPSGLYCNLSGSTAHLISLGLTALAMLTILIVEVLLAKTVRRVWKSSGRENGLGNMSLDAIARVAAFSFCPIIALAVSLVQFLPGQENSEVKFTLVIAALPCCAVLIFGSQKDILRTWMFWKH